MERNEKSLQNVINFLLAHGYPQESIAIEYPVGRYRADLAILDIDTRELIAIFEFKSKRTSQTEKFGKEQLRTFLKASSNPSIPTYLVFDKEQFPFYEIEKILVNDPEAMMTIVTEKPLDYNILKKSGKNIVIALKKEEKKKAFDGFRIVCWISAFLVVIILLLDIFGDIELTEKQLVLFAVFIFLLIIPFASKLKILGVEFERITEKNK